MLLQHIHYPTSTPILYTHALHIQELFARQHLSHKALLSSRRSTISPSTSSQSSPQQSASTPPAPLPKLLTFTTKPTYTTGLRDSRSLAPEQISTITATGAAHHASPRGGLTTYHGPGQLTAFLITTLAQHKLSPRCYVHFLEDAVIRTAGSYGVRAARWTPGDQAKGDGLADESRPGVWVSETGKLCSVGIHFRRGVSSFGIGFNVTDEMRPWFDRIVACGIPEAKAVSLAGEMDRLGVEAGVEVDHVAGKLAEAVAEGLDGVDGVETVDSRALGEMNG